MSTLSIALATLAVVVLSAGEAKYGLGRAPTPEQVKAWDISIGPDGTGLPEGNGTVIEGKDVYARRCQRCHGANAAGGDEGPLVGGKGSLGTAKPLKTVASYWPYATTLWDYVNRTMPYDRPGALTPDEVYAVTAYVLFLNGIVAERDSLTKDTLPRVRMPNRDGFVR